MHHKYMNKSLLQLEDVQHHIVDIDKYIRGEMSEEECKEIAKEIANTGILLMKDSRVSEDDAERFLDFMEEYYSRPWEELEKDIYPEVAYQYGLTPPKTEYPRGYTDEVQEWRRGVTDEHMPYTYRSQEEKTDEKMRFMWQVGERDENSEWPSLNQKTPVPEGLTDMQPVLETWGSKMLETAFTLSEILSIGFGWEKDTLRTMLKKGPHILGPTGSELGEYTNADIGHVMTGLHDDTNLITVHGASRFRGLVCWTKQGDPFLVTVPKGHLLCQAGRMLQYITAGYAEAGMHEVVVLPELLEDVQMAKNEGRSTTRVSSNLFVHLASNQVLQPLGKFAETDDAIEYPPQYAGNFCMRTWVETKMIDESALDSLPEDPTV